MLARLRTSPNKDRTTRAIVITGALLILAAVVAAYASHVARNLSGEAFYDFQYAYRLPFWDAWRTFFIERIRSRLMHGVFISAVYGVVGYNPRAIYLSVYLLVALTATLIIWNLKPHIKRPWVAALLTVVFALLPVAIPELVELKKLHHVLAWFLFWVSVTCFGQWIRTNSRGWLFAGTLAFLASVLAYEATVGLLPIAIILNLPGLRGSKDFVRKSGVVIFVTLCAAFVFLRLESLKEFTGIAQTYPDYSSPTSTAAKAFAAVPQLLAAIWKGDLFGVNLPSWLVLATQAALLVVFGLAIWTIVRGLKGRLWRFEQLQIPAVVLGLAAVYFTLVTYLPFMLAGQAPEADGLRGAAIGLVLLALIPLQSSNARWLRVGFATVCGLLIGAGLLAYSVSDRAAVRDDAYLSRFIYTLKEQVPGVRGGANFVFVNSGVGRTGCIGLMNMLYGRNDLHCIHLFDNDEQEKYIRVPEGLQEVGGRLWDAGFILITIAPDGTAVLLDEISQQEFPAAPIIWDVLDPVMPDADYILQTDFENPTKTQRAAIKMLRLQQPSVLYNYFATQATK